MLTIETSRRIDITGFDADIDTLREIVRLARERLAESERFQLRGCGGLERQAGLITPQLNNVRDTLDRLAEKTGLPPLQLYVDEPTPIFFIRG